jgi:hypothetical protein
MRNAGRNATVNINAEKNDARKSTMTRKQGTSAMTTHMTGTFDVSRRVSRNVMGNRIAANEWWTRGGSNSQPLGCKPSALPVELPVHIGTGKKVVLPGQTDIILYKSKACKVLHRYFSGFFSFQYAEDRS